MKTLAEEIGQAVAEFERRTNGNGLLGVTTGYSDLDELFGGWPRRMTSLVAAQTSVGKTQFALNCLLRTATSLLDAGGQAVVGLYEMEMGLYVLVCRMVAILLAMHGKRVDSKNIMRGKVSEEEKMWVLGGFEKLYAIGRHIYIDTESRDTDSIARSLTQWKAKYDVPLIVIDYIGRLGDESLDASGVSRQGDISRKLTHMALLNDAHVMAVIDLNREAEKKKGAPTMANIRWGVSAGYDADIVVMLDRPALTAHRATGQPLEEDGLLVLHVEKNRYGTLGKLDLTIDLPTGLIVPAGQGDAMPKEIYAWQ